MLFFTTLFFTSIASHIHNWALFTLGLCFFLVFEVISLLFSSSILGTYEPGSSSFSVISFCLFILLIGFSRQECWGRLPFPSPVDHVFSELSTMTHASWVALHGIAHSFTELDKAVVQVIRLASFLWLWFSVIVVFSLSALWWRRIRGLWKLPDGRDWLRGKLGLVLMSLVLLGLVLFLKYKKTQFLKTIKSGQKRLPAVTATAG